MGKSQFEVGRAQRFLAVACVCLALLFAGLESTHAHADAKTSSPCVICVSTHANALSVTFHLLPVLRPVQPVPPARPAEGRGIAKELRLFIRPPPAV
jgi:hypothetical protein